MEILKQKQNDPYTVEEQIAIIYAGSKNLLRKVPVESIKGFERDYLDLLKAKHGDALQTLKEGKLTDEVTDVLEAVANDIAARFQ